MKEGIIEMIDIMESLLVVSYSAETDFVLVRAAMQKFSSQLPSVD